MKRLLMVLLAAALLLTGCVTPPAENGPMPTPLQTDAPAEPAAESDAGNEAATPMPEEPADLPEPSGETPAAGGVIESLYYAYGSQSAGAWTFLIWGEDGQVFASAEQ